MGVYNIWIVSLIIKFNKERLNEIANQSNKRQMVSGQEVILFSIYA